MSRVPDPAELADDLTEIKQQISALTTEIKSGYVGRELYEAKHMGLRNEIALEFAAMKLKVESNREAAASARNLAMWCLGVLSTAVVVALVGFLATGGAGT